MNSSQHRDHSPPKDCVQYINTRPPYGPVLAIPRLLAGNPRGGAVQGKGDWETHKIMDDPLSPDESGRRLGQRPLF